MSILNFNRVQLRDASTDKDIGGIRAVHRIPGIGEGLYLTEKNETVPRTFRVEDITTIWCLPAPDPQERVTVVIYLREI